MSTMLIRRRLFTTLATFGAVGLVTKRTFFPRYMKEDDIMLRRRPPIIPKYESCAIPTRDQFLARMKSTKQFDILVIGGGASGAGCALDAASRGLATAMIDRGDFASETSSKSTKLIHGGVRYLEKAVFNLDKEQYDMVAEALEERSNLISNSPHTSGLCPTLIPIFGSVWQSWLLFYYYAGMKVYDLVAGRSLLAPSRMFGPEKTRELFPTINRQRRLIGSVMYYDGQHNDARTNLEIVLTAAQHGASVANHVEVMHLIKEPGEEGKEKITGAKCRDKISGEVFDIRSKVVINATGPHTDHVRQMSEPKCEPICLPSRGTHITLDRAVAPDGQVGILQPHTKDGRVIFCLPWEEAVVAGTTDIPDEPNSLLEPTDAEIDFIVEEVNELLDEKFRVSRQQVKSCWAGIRPLIKDPTKKDSQSLVRNHLVVVDGNGLVSIVGGKWTTYRSMAEETVDEAVKHHGLKPERSCITRALPFHGSYEWSPVLDREIALSYHIPLGTARYLVRKYGDQTRVLLDESKNADGKITLIPLLKGYQEAFFEQEIAYTCKYEMVEDIIDVLARRMRITFHEADEAMQCVEKVAHILAEQKQWSAERKAEQIEKARQLIRTQFMVK